MACSHNWKPLFSNGAWCNLCRMVMEINDNGRYRTTTLPRGVGGEYDIRQEEVE